MSELDRRQFLKASAAASVAAAVPVIPGLANAADDKSAPAARNPSAA